MLCRTVFEHTTKANRCTCNGIALVNIGAVSAKSAALSEGSDAQKALPDRIKCFLRRAVICMHCVIQALVSLFAFHLRESFKIRI